MQPVLGELGGGREWFRRVHYEHDERMQIGRSTARDLHRHSCSMVRFGLAGLDLHEAVRHADGLLTGEDQKRFRAGMGVNGGQAAGCTARFVDSERYSGAVKRGIGPTSANLLPPFDKAPAGPSEKTQIFPAASTTIDHLPAAALASSRAVYVSIRHKSSPSGSCATFLSASGLITSGSSAHAAEAAASETVARAREMNLIRRPPVRTNSNEFTRSLRKVEARTAHLIAPALSRREYPSA